MHVFFVRARLERDFLWVVFFLTSWALSFGWFYAYLRFVKGHVRTMKFIISFGIMIYPEVVNWSGDFL